MLAKHLKELLSKVPDNFNVMLNFDGIFDEAPVFIEIYADDILMDTKNMILEIQCGISEEVEEQLEEMLNSSEHIGPDDIIVLTREPEDTRGEIKKRIAKSGLYVVTNVS